MSQDEISEEKLLNDLRRVANELGKPPTVLEYKEHGTYSRYTFRERYGSWNDSLTEANLGVNKRSSVSKDELISDLKRVADILGETPSIQDYTEHGRHGVGTVNRAFGSWNDGLIEADLPVVQEQTLPLENLVRDLRRVANDLGRSPTQIEYKKHGDYTHPPFYRRFGGWNLALRAVGLDPTVEQNLSSETLITDLQERITGNVAPPWNDFQDKSRVSEGTYTRRFDGYWKAVVEAGFRPYTPRPLRLPAFRKYHATASALSPETAVIALLPQFTGLSTTMIAEFSEDWQANRTDKRIIQVPKRLTDTDLTWMFRIPETWIDPVTGEEHPTHLPELLDWYWEHYDSIHTCWNNINNIIRRTGKKAGLSEYRREVDYSIGTHPEIQSIDLTITYVINLARRSIDSEVLSRRLGLGYRETNLLDLEKVFIWCENNTEDFSHPDWGGL